MDQGIFGKVGLPLLECWMSHKRCVPMGTGGVAARGGMDHLTCGSF